MKTLLEPQFSATILHIKFHQNNTLVAQVSASAVCEDGGHNTDQMGPAEREGEGDQRTIRNIYLGPNQDCYNEGDINWEINYGQLH